MMLDEVNMFKFVDWLLTLPDATDLDILGEAGYKLLSQWHKAVG